MCKYYVWGDSFYNSYCFKPPVSNHLTVLHNCLGQLMEREKLGVLGQLDAGW